MFFSKVLICGLGLIGGSFAKKFKEDLFAEKIIAIDRDADSLQKAQSEGVIDGSYPSVAKLKESKEEDFDCIIIATFVGDFKEILEQIKPLIKENTIVFDVGSLKYPIVCAALDVLKDYKYKFNFIAAHPIAGKEVSGFKSSEADLFDNAKMIMTPFDMEQASSDNFIKMKGFFKNIFAKVIILSAEGHDYIYGFCSHFIQYISFHYFSSYGKVSNKLKANNGKRDLGELWREFTDSLDHHKDKGIIESLPKKEIEFSHYRNFYKDFLAKSLRLCHVDPGMWRSIFIYDDWMREYLTYGDIRDLSSLNLRDDLIQALLFYRSACIRSSLFYIELYLNDFKQFMQELKKLSKIRKDISLELNNHNVSDGLKKKYKPVVRNILKEFLEENHKSKNGVNDNDLFFEQELILLHIVIAMSIIRMSLNNFVGRQDFFSLLSVDNFHIKSNNRFLDFLDFVGSGYLDSTSILELI